MAAKNWDVEFEMTNSFTEILKPLLQEAGFEHYGFSPLENPFSIGAYEDWIHKGYHGEMEYLKTHLPFKKEPTRHFKGLQSAIVVAKPYFPNSTTPTPLRIAEYAKSRDYHLTFKEELDAVAEKLKAQFLGEEFLCFTDSAPLLERDLAYRAGLGWIGKNTCLIDRKQGSLFFLGEILTSLSLEAPKERTLDFCGKCSKCIEICPTNALEENRILNAKKCISYLTIESKKIPDQDLRKQMGDWFFGCDLCQTVCPWNEKKYGKDLMQSLTEPVRFSKTSEEIESLRKILTKSNKELLSEFKESPLSRARGFGLKRNALIVIANQNVTELKDEVEHASRQWPRLKELCDWVLESFHED